MIDDDDNGNDDSDSDDDYDVEDQSLRTPEDSWSIIIILEIS